MGSYERGILGAFSGKVGNVIGASWRGIDYMRSLPRKGNRKFNQTQIEQQLKLALAINFMKPNSELVNPEFKNQSKQRLNRLQHGGAATLALGLSLLLFWLSRRIFYARQIHGSKLQQHHAVQKQKIIIRCL